MGRVVATGTCKNCGQDIYKNEYDFGAHIEWAHVLTGSVWCVPTTKAEPIPEAVEKKTK